MGCQICGGTFIGPVGTTREASNMVQSGFPVPPLHVRCAPLLVENAPELLALKESAPSCPVMFRISSRPHAPAIPSAPSAQFRKRARLFENSIGLNGFSAGLRPFRAWVLGVDETAGAWNAPGVPNITGKIGARSPGTTLVGAFFLSPNTEGMPCGTFVGSDSNRGINAPTLDASRSSTIYGASSTVMPPSVNIPVIIYLGRPR